MIRVELPYHLRNLAKVSGEVQFDLVAPVTLGRVVDALEERYPTLQGTIRDYNTGKRRSLVRFYACQRDLSNEPFDALLPEEVADGREPLLVIGALAGG